VQAVDDRVTVTHTVTVTVLTCTVGCFKHIGVCGMNCADELLLVLSIGSGCSIVDNLLKKKCIL
jgi:hypothetical protein